MQASKQASKLACCCCCCCCCRHCHLCLYSTLVPLTHFFCIVIRILNKISVTTRFAFNGMLSNVLFMMAYNWSIQNVPEVAPPTMYSIVYLVFIPIGHAMVSLFVFGWPEHYCPSLMSNFPIGLTAIGIGGGLTAWLDSIDFNEMVADYVRNNFTFSTMPKPPGEEAGSEFYSSIVVLVVTSLWTYVLSIYVNSPPEKSEKKEL